MTEKKKSTIIMPDDEAPQIKRTDDAPETPVREHRCETCDNGCFLVAAQEWGECRAEPPKATLMMVPDALGRQSIKPISAFPPSHRLWYCGAYRPLASKVN